MSRRELSSFRWDGAQWATIKVTSHLEVVSKASPTNEQGTISTMSETIRVATLNILADCFPWFIEMAIRSPERFEWLCNGITTLNSTILGLNEVTATALQQLQESPFIRENYFITESFHSTKNDGTSELSQCINELLSPHGCVILNKLPLLEVFAISVSGSTREAVVGKVQLNSDLEKCVYFCAHHTTAYQTPKNAQLRAQQIGDIIDTLEPLGLPFVILGDLNLHYQSEDAVVVDNQFIDAWAQTHFSQIYPFNDENEGYTFDVVKNSLIPYYIPGECRQMRLDRILFSRGFPAFAVSPTTLWANEPIKSDNYLFPSDHFGLFIDLTIHLADDSQKVMSMGEPDPSAEELLRRNAQNKTDREPFSTGLLRRTTAMVSHIGWLAAVVLGLK